MVYVSSIEEGPNSQFHNANARKSCDAFTYLEAKRCLFFHFLVASVLPKMTPAKAQTGNPSALMCSCSNEEGTSQLAEQGPSKNG